MEALPSHYTDEQEQLEQLKDDFLNSISHELRSPLSNIRMATQMLKVLFQQDEGRSMAISDRLSYGASTSPTNTALPTRIHDAFDESSLKTRVVNYIKILEYECDREITLLNNVLDLQQLDAGTYGFSNAVIHFQDWLPKLIQPFLVRIDQQQQQLKVDGVKNLPDIVTDPLSLERMLNELLTNACKFTPPGGKITIAASILPLTAFAATQTLQLKVTNSKVEIPASALSRIFERFYRIPHYNRWKHSGTGLGLALVKALAEHLGGSISATSGNGQTCFTAAIPINSAEVERSRLK